MVQFANYVSPQQYKRVAPMTYQEMAYVPSLLQGRHEKAQADLVADEKALQFEYLQEDDPFVKDKIKTYQDRIDNLSKQLAGSGVGSSTPVRQELANLQQDYVREIGPQGTLGRAKSNYDTAMSQWQDWKKANPKSSQMYQEQAKEKFFGDYKGMQDEFGNYNPFKAGEIVGEIDIPADFSNFASKLGYTPEKLQQMTYGVKFEPMKDPVTGITGVKVIQTHPGVGGSTNAPQLQKLADEWLAQYRDTSTRRGKYRDIAGISDDNLVRTITNMQGALTNVKGGKAPTQTGSFRFAPQSSGGTRSGSSSGTPSVGGKSLISRTIPMETQNVFEKPKDVLKDRSSDNPYKKDLANNLIAQAFTVDNIPQDYKYLIGDTFNPTEVYDKLLQEKDILKKQINSDIQTEAAITRSRMSQAQAVQAGMQVPTGNLELNKKKLKDIESFEEVVENNLKNTIDVANEDLSAPVYSFNPMMKSYSTVKKNLDTYVNDLTLQDMVFISGPLKGKNPAKLASEKNYTGYGKAQKVYDNMKPKGSRNITGVGVTPDEGIFFTMRDSEGNEHGVRFKDQTTANNFLLAEEFEKPDFLKVEVSKNDRIVGDKYYSNGIPTKLNFKVKKDKDSSGHRVYKVEGVSNADFYYPIISKIKKENPNMSEDEQYIKLLTTYNINPNIDWESPYMSRYKIDILNYNEVLNKSK